MSMLPEEDIRQQNIVGWKAAVTAPTYWFRILEDWKLGPVNHIAALGGSFPLGQQWESLCAQQSLKFPLVVLVTAYPLETG